MTDSKCLIEQAVQESDEDESRLYIDESVFGSMNHNDRQASKSINTGNPFELDLNLIANLNRYRTRYCQTILTSNTNLLVQRNRSTFCQAEYFSTITQETNTDCDNNNEKEERILVVKRKRTENIDL